MDRVKRNGGGVQSRSSSIRPSSRTRGGYQRYSTQESLEMPPILSQQLQLNNLSVRYNNYTVQGDQVMKLKGFMLLKAWKQVKHKLPYSYKDIQINIKN